MMRSFPFVLGALLAVPLLAQPKEGGSFVFSQDIGYQASRELGDLGGELEGWRTETTVGYLNRTGDNLLSIEFSVDWRENAFTNVPLLGAGPYDEVRSFGLSAFNLSKLNETWGWAAFGGIRASAEEDADLGDGLTASLGGGATYYVNEKLSITFGAIVATQLEDSTRILPGIMVDWQITDDLRLRTMNGVELTYDTGAASYPIQIDASIQVDSTSFRIKEDRGGGAGDELSVPFVLGVRLPISKQIALRPWVSYSLYNETELRNTNGDVYLDFEPDNAVGFGVKLSGRF